MKNINKWDSLSIKDKADLMKLYIKNGINNLEDIRSHYNKFQDGGNKNNPLKTISGTQKPYYEIPESTRKVLRGLAIRNRDKEALFRLGYNENGDDLAIPGGGSFGGSGAGSSFDSGLVNGNDFDYIKNTPLLRSFSEAFNDARKSGKNTFIFNGKKYTTEVSDNPNYIGKQYEPMLNIREVLDKNMKVIPDSTRIEPYLGQIPGTSKREYDDGGNLVLKDTSPTYNNWQEAINDSWYKPVYDNMWVGTIPYKSMYQNKDATTKLPKNTTIDNFINVMYPIVEQSMISKGKNLKNVDNMVKQIAYESNYGRSSRGNGYNLAGIKEFDSSKPRTKYKDGQYYKDFSDYRDFTDYYVDLVTNRYEVENANNLKDYVDRLHGKNSSGKSYSTNRKYYRDMKNMKTLDKKIKNYKK